MISQTSETGTAAVPDSAGESGEADVVIRVAGVTHVYRKNSRGPADSGEVPVLSDISLDIRRGEFVSLVGASGCGKTTLLNMMAGLMFPSTGEVAVHGRPAKAKVPGVAYMGARDALLPWRSVRRNVEFALEETSLSRRDRRRRGREMLGVVGLADFENHYPRELSSGMRQRTNLARTLAADPEVLLMDEPFGALDAQTKTNLHLELLRILESTPGGREKTVVFVTHDLQEALLLSDRVVVLHPRPGRIAADREVPLERPRSAHLRETMFAPEFKELHEQLFLQLEGDGNVGGRGGAA